MRRPRSTEYPDDLKREVVAAIHSGRSMAAVSKEFAIPNQTISKWMQAAREGRLFKEPNLKLSAEEAEIARLKAELYRVSLERDVLAKALMFFARQARQ